ncbi:CD180 antigen [Bufo gargarizans]|uniref:CD180 antigen n=1 Tax=Bufo gargarizans TaxID=30331 RepID=UPI001CF5A4CB|nr:CD180 antigen [Bufo gargarizans]
MTFTLCFVFMLACYPGLSKETEQSEDMVCSEVIANKSYSCEGLGLQEVPDVIPPSTETLDFSFNSLLALYYWVFSRLTNLEYLDLTRCGINWIYNDAFGNKARLNTVKLTGNPILYIADTAFLGATSLQHLHLQETSIVDISFIPLTSLKDLVSLHLGSNFISSIRFPQDITLDNLTLVNFALNQINTISVKDSEYFKKIQNLTLILKGNNIDYIEPNAFNHSYFHQLDLTGCGWNTNLSSLLNGLNGLTTNALGIGTFYDISTDFDIFPWSLNGLCNISVKELSLQYRHISEGSQETFSCLTKIQKLDLTGTNLKFLQHLSQPSYIKELILDGNSFSSLCSINSGSFPLITHLQIVGNRDTWDWGTKCLENLSNLKYLDLSHNDFRKAKCCGAQFSGLHNLSHLNLSYGSPLPLDSLAFPENVQLEILDFSNVHLLMDESLSPFSNLADLRILNLSYSHVNTSHMQLLEGLTSVVFLNMEGNSVHNGILKSENMFSKVLQLETLILSNCDLEVLEKQTFQKLKNLKCVDLRHNKLTTFATNAFGNLTDVSLNFAFNMISTIPIVLVQNISDKSIINLSYNPIDCSCSNLEFLTWFKQHEKVFLDKSNTMCGSPPSLAGTELTKVAITCGISLTHVLLIVIITFICIIVIIWLIQYYRRRIYAAI